jgi:fatty acid desaturase
MGSSHSAQPDVSTNARPPGPTGWWAPKLERATVQRLLRKRDLPGVLFFMVWLAIVAATTWLLAIVWGSLWVLPVLVLHGAVLSFAYAASHEGAHGTAFKTTWLNEAVFYLTSFIFGEEPMYRRYSHGRHHSATWYPGYDSQMPYQNPMTRRAYLRETLALTAPFIGIAQMFRHATGSLTDAERSFVPAAKVKQLVWGARLFLIGYAGVFVLSILLRSAFPLVAFFAARLAGGWVVQLFINSQHMCMSEAMPDHRFSTRSLACSPPTRVLYWNMNFHIEHHLYPGVPFHALPSVNRLVRDELPLPTRGAWAANVEILRVIHRQADDPACVARPSFALQRATGS